MEKIFLSVLVICALAIGAMGGILAGWSDTEESMNNYIATGSIDSEINGIDEFTGRTAQCGPGDVETGITPG